MNNLKVFILTIAVGGLLFTGCCKEQTNELATAKVHVGLNGFKISQDEIDTKDAQNAEDYTGVGAVILAFYASDGTEMYQSTQLRSDPSTYTTFGEFNCDLPIGSYTMVAVARQCGNDDEFTLTSPTLAGYSSERVRETFCATQSVSVTSSTPLDLTATLNRVNTQVKIHSTDGRPAEAVKIRTTYGAGGKSFSPTTGLATSDNGFSVTNNPSTAVGATINVNNMAFLATDEETMTMTIEVLDANDNVLITKVIPNVPLKRNRQTTLTGAVFTGDASAVGFQLETGWMMASTSTSNN